MNAGASRPLQVASASDTSVSRGLAPYRTEAAAKLSTRPSGLSHTSAWLSRRGHNQKAYPELAVWWTPMARKTLALEIEGRDVVITNPDKVFFPRTGNTKLDLVNYYLSVADGAIRGVDGRPMAMKRFVNGAESEHSFRSARRSRVPTGLKPSS